MIPKGTLAKVLMTIKAGGFDDPAQGWTGGLATRSEQTGSIYLQAEFVVLEGQYAKRKIWSNIGLFSAKGPAWGDMGRAFLKGALNSALGLDPKDNSEIAQKKRRVSGLESFIGLEIVARVDVEKDQYGDLRNTIKNVITPDHREYKVTMGKVTAPAVAPVAPVSPVATQAPPSAHNPVAPQQDVTPVPNRPKWS